MVRSQSPARFSRMDAPRSSNYLESMAKRQVLPAALARVPFLDLAPMHDGLKEEILAEISDLIDAGAFTNGPQVAAFETEFARY